MSHSLLTIRAFSTELMKIATRIKDAEIQKLLAEREGKEYLEGGRLLTNTADEAEYARKMAGYTPRVGQNMAAGTYDVLGSKTKKDNKYQTARDYAGTAMKGGLTGLGVLGAYNAMKGNFGAPSGAFAVRKAMHAARRAAGVGATAAVADRAYRHDAMPGHHEKTANVNANPNAGFKSPAESLARTNQTGSFRSGMVHGAGATTKPLQLGQKFRIP